MKTTLGPHGQLVTRSETRIAVALVTAVAVLGGAWGVADHFAFGTGAFDSGVIDHAMWRITHGYDDVSSLNGFSLFADHPSPILVLLLPVYFLKPAWGLPAYFVLRAFSAGMVVWAAWLLTGRLGLDRATRWTLVGGTAVGPGLILVLIAETNTVSLAVGPLAVAIAIALTRGPIVWFGVLIGLSAAARPEIAVGIVIVGFLLKREFPEYARVGFWVGGIGSTLGLGWMLAAGEAGGVSVHLGHLGNSFREASLAALQNPIDALRPLFELEPWMSLVIWLAGFGLIAPVVAGRWLLVGVPLLAIPFLGTGVAADRFIWQYWHILLPMGMVASVVSVVHRRLSPEMFRKSVAVLLPLTLLLAIAPIAPMPIPRRSAAATDAAEAVAIIEEAGYQSVSAPFLVVPHLTRRPVVHSFPFPFQCGFSVANYQSPDLLPEAVMLFERDLAEWRADLDAYGYRQRHATGSVRIWVDESPQPAPDLVCP